MAAILSRPQCVNSNLPGTDESTVLTRYFSARHQVVMDWGALVFHTEMPEAEPGQYVGRLHICPVGRSQTNHGEEHPNSQQTHQQWHLVPTPFVCGRDDSGKRVDITALLHFTRDVIRAAVSTTHLCSDKTISFTGIQDEEDCFEEKVNIFHFCLISQNQMAAGSISKLKYVMLFYHIRALSQYKDHLSRFKQMNKVSHCSNCPKCLWSFCPVREQSLKL